MIHCIPDSYAGLHCEVIEGYSKGAGYKPGMKLEGSRFRNSWTAVCIDGSWCFLNCNWGARHVRGGGQDTATATATTNTGSSSHHHHHGRDHHRGHGRRRRGSCAKENVDCSVKGSSLRGGDASGSGGGGLEGGVAAAATGPAAAVAGSGGDGGDQRPESCSRVIVTTTAESCVDSRHIVDHCHDGHNDHSLLRLGGRDSRERDKDKDSPLRQLIRYASADILTLRSGDRTSTVSGTSSASGQSSDRTSTGSTTTTSSAGKSDSTQSDSNGSNCGSSDNNTSGACVYAGCRKRTISFGEGCKEEDEEEEEEGGGRGGRGRGGGKGQEFHYKCDEFYFMTDPEDHIFQHYPDDPEWQVRTRCMHAF